MLKACIGSKVVLKDLVEDFYLFVGLRIESSTHVSFNKRVGAYFDLEFGSNLGVSVRDYSLRRAILKLNILIE